MSEKPHIVGKLELACRGCDFILPHSGANKVLSADFKNRNEACYKYNLKDGMGGPPTAKPCAAEQER